MGHLGLTPQSVHAMGGFRVQGKSVDAAAALLDAAKALAAAGCFAIVLEGVPDVVGCRGHRGLDVPTIGIGAGPACDGQVLVFHDLLGLGQRGSRPSSSASTPTWAEHRAPRPSRRLPPTCAAGAFPSEAETYHAPDGLRGRWLDRRRA